MKVQNWIEGFLVTPSDLFSHWRCWDGLVVNRKELKRGLVDEIQMLSWKWSLARLKIQPCLFFEWRWNPRWCLGVLGWAGLELELLELSRFATRKYLLLFFPLLVGRTFYSFGVLLSYSCSALELGIRRFFSETHCGVEVP